MLTIHVKGKGLMYWHIGEEVPYLSITDEVVFVQADGDELRHIVDNFLGIPMAKRKVVRWTGDAANFIAHNLMPHRKGKAKK